MGGAGVTLARDPEHPSYIRSREIFGIAIQAPAIPAAAIFYPIADSPKKRRGRPPADEKPQESEGTDPA